MIGNPFTNDDWAAETADQIDRVVGAVRDRVTNNAVRAVRALVFGTIGLILGIVVSILGVILVTRGVQSLISLGTGNTGVGHGRSVYLGYLALGAILVVAGALCMKRRGRSDDSAA